MIIDTGNILLIGAVLLFFSIIAGKAGFRFGVPVLLLFLGVGMLLFLAMFCFYGDLFAWLEDFSEDKPII